MGHIEGRSGGAIHRGMVKMVSHQSHNLKFVGSSPTPATNAL